MLVYVAENLSLSSWKVGYFPPSKINHQAIFYCHKIGFQPQSTQLRTHHVNKNNPSENFWRKSKQAQKHLAININVFGNRECVRVHFISKPPFAKRNWILYWVFASLIPWNGFKITRIARIFLCLKTVFVDIWSWARFWVRGSMLCWNRWQTIW